jgi:hypothetical protein
MCVRLNQRVATPLRCVFWLVRGRWHGPVRPADRPQYPVPPRAFSRHTVRPRATRAQLCNRALRLGRVRRPAPARRCPAFVRAHPRRRQFSILIRHRLQHHPRCRGDRGEERGQRGGQWVPVEVLDLVVRRALGQRAENRREVGLRAGQDGRVVQPLRPASSVVPTYLVGVLPSLVHLSSRLLSRAVCARCGAESGGPGPFRAFQLATVGPRRRCGAEPQGQPKQLRSSRKKDTLF